MTWQLAAHQRMLPRHDEGVDYGATRSLLLERRMPDGLRRRLEWHPGAYLAVGARGMGRTYTTAALVLTGGKWGDVGFTLLDGGRLSRVRLREVVPKIRKHFELSEDDTLPIDRWRTFVWADPAV